MSAERLEVWLEGRYAGVLEPARGTLVFRYAKATRTDPAATPLSLSMPLAGPECHEGGPANLFFAGLLPECRVLEYVASQHRVSDSNGFGLLEAVGGVERPAYAGFIRPRRRSLRLHRDPRGRSARPRCSSS